MPQLLIKADDLRPAALSPKWKAFLEFCVERGIHANVGIMGGWNQKGTDVGADPEAAREMLAWFNAQPTLHLWNHGVTHKGQRTTRTSEFRGASLEEQVEAIRKTQDVVEELGGIRMDAFGAPFNWTDHNTVAALQQFPEIKYSFHVPYVPGKVNFHHELFVTCEPFVDVNKPGAARRFALLAALEKSRHFRDIGRSFVLQIHPNRWNEGSLEKFGQFIDRLESEGYTTGTLASFAETGVFAGPDTAPRLLPHRDPSAPVRRPKPAWAVRAAQPPRVHWTQRVPAPLRRAVPPAVRRRLRGIR